MFNCFKKQREKIDLKTECSITLNYEPSVKDFSISDKAGLIICKSKDGWLVVARAQQTLHPKDKFVFGDDYTYVDTRIFSAPENYHIEIIGEVGSELTINCMPDRPYAPKIGEVFL